MTLPKWDEEMKYELLRLKSELRSDNFRVLHNPIGLGRLSGGDGSSFGGKELFPMPKLAQPLFAPPHDGPAPLAAPLRKDRDKDREKESGLLAAIPPLPPLPPLPQTQSQSQAPMPLKAQAVASPLPTQLPLPLPPLSAEGLSLSSRVMKKAIAHSLDLTFVVMTLGLGLLLATWLIGPVNVSENPDHLKHAAPLRFLMESSTLALVLGVYGFFSFYWLFFKLVSGSTLGESFLDNFSSLQNSRNTPPVNDSGDS